MIAFFLAALETSEDREQFIEVYEKYHLRMGQVALHILGEQQDAEDAVQNAFIQVIRHFEKVHQISCEELPFWLISIVKNEALMILRKRNKMLVVEDLECVDAAADDVNSYHELVELIRGLPETYRAVLELKLIAGYSDKEIAAYLHISETAVSSRASRGRALLRGIIEKEGIYP